MSPLIQNTNLVSWLSSDAIKNIENLIDGSYITNSLLPISQINPSNFPQPVGAITSTALQPTSSSTSINGLQSSTVYGFVRNSLLVQIPGQPGIQPLQFANIMSFTPDTKMYYLQQQSFSCGYVKTFVFSFCLGALLGDIFYNGIIYVIYNALVFFFQQIIQQVIMAFIMIPIQGMSQIFKDGLNTIAQPGADPIQALAQMGIMYINFSGNLWMGLMAMAVTSALIPMFGIFIFALFAFVLPLLFAWIGIMVSVGFTTAYYIPILPYMIFTFGSIAWLISVIEAMVAAPIVALGVTHPEGHDAFGKGEAAIMLLMNVFLRPAMMIIGYISAIALSYVSVWILNAGFDNAIMYIQGGNSNGIGSAGMELSLPATGASNASFTGNSNSSYSTGGIGPQTGSGSGGYKDWAGIYAYFFSILLYTTMYLTVVQKAFTLISYLPDKVLRWIGGSPESLGAESAQWGDEQVKGKMGEASKGTQDAQGQMGKQLGGMGQKAAGAMKGKMDKGSEEGSVKARGGKDGGESTPSVPGK
jgi:defect-in-organelle-trafficking protein DotA